MILTFNVDASKSSIKDRIPNTFPSMNYILNILVSWILTDKPSIGQWSPYNCYMPKKHRNDLTKYID